MEGWMDTIKPHYIPFGFLYSRAPQRIIRHLLICWSGILKSNNSWIAWTIILGFIFSHRFIIESAVIKCVECTVKPQINYPLANFMLKVWLEMAQKVSNGFKKFLILMENSCFFCTILLMNFTWLCAVYFLVCVSTLSLYSLLSHLLFLYSTSAVSCYHNNLRPSKQLAFNTICPANTNRIHRYWITIKKLCGLQDKVQSNKNGV